MCGIVGAIAYYALVQLSEGLLRDESLPIAPVVWMPNLVLIVVATVLIFRAGRHASESDRSSGKGEAGLLERLGIKRKGLHMKRWALSRYVSAQFIRMVVLCIGGLVGDTDDCLDTESLEFGKTGLRIGFSPGDDAGR